MNKAGVFFLAVCLACVALAAEARLYRWVDENGKVQFSDNPPPANAKGLTELDQRGTVRKMPSRAASAGEVAERAAERQRMLEQRRRDRALLQSFSRPEEIDFLRDRQIEAVEARRQTNALQRQAVNEKVSRLTAQAESLANGGRPVPNSVTGGLESARRELSALDVDLRKMDEEIAAIRARAEADKRRFIELRGLPQR